MKQNRKNYKIHYNIHGEVWIRAKSEEDARDQFSKLEPEWLLANSTDYAYIDEIWESDLNYIGDEK